jgi:hypothetical protein
VAFSLLYSAWMVNRVRLQKMMDQAETLKVRVLQRLQGEGA